MIGLRRMLGWLLWDVVVTVAVAAMLLEYRLVPLTVGLKIDLVACRVQYYQRFLGACYPIDQKYFFYRGWLERLYLQYIGPWPTETQWVTDYESFWWLGDHRSDNSEVFSGFIWDQNGLANTLSGRMKAADNRTVIPAPEDAATARIIFRFLQLARESGSPEASRYYSHTIRNHLRENPHMLTLEELLEIEKQLDAEKGISSR